METKTAIDIDGISKRYRIASVRASYSTLREKITDLAARPVRLLMSGKGSEGDRNLNRSHSKNTFWALKDIHLHVDRGEVLGLIGRNGAGKSTLLKILSRITEPTTGHADIYGRIGSLLEVGTGFHPELTGRENTFLSGAILGMRRSEINRQFDDIVSFAEIEKFIDTPVKHYSSGMYLRLAFSVAAHLDTEILLVDEVLAVGDARFQTRCLGKMEDVSKQGRTVVFVSHNMAAVSNLCSRVIALKDGQIWADGQSNVISEYLNSITDTATVDLRNRTDTDAKNIWGTDIWFEDERGEKVVMGLTGKSLSICLRYKRRIPGNCPDVTMTFYDAFGHAVTSCSTTYSIVREKSTYPQTQGVIKCILPKLPLLPGEYRLNVLIHRKGEWEDHLPSIATLHVEQGDFFNTGRLPTANKTRILMEHSWQAESTNAATAPIFAA